MHSRMRALDRRRRDEDEDDEMAKKTVKAGMNTSRDGLVDMGTVPGTMKTLVRATNGWIGESRHRDRAEGGVGVGDARGE